MRQETTATLYDVPAKTKGRKRTHSGRFTELDANKLRGGYYTSNELARWMCDWAIRSSDDLILEPVVATVLFWKRLLSDLRGSAR